MSEGNKIIIDEIKSFEITIAKCGLLQLNAIAYPAFNCFEYKIVSNNELIFENTSLEEAIKIYNELL